MNRADQTGNLQPRIIFPQGQGNTRVRRRHKAEDRPLEVGTKNPSHIMSRDELEQPCETEKL